MGIINITPDSFYKGSRRQAIDEIVDKTESMLSEGAGIIDIGGQSTRPGAEIIGAGEEAARVVAAIEAVCSHFPGAIISVDTFFAAVAGAAVKAGASIVNDVSGGLYDVDMLSTVAQLKVPYVCMHHRGIPASSRVPHHYDSLIKEVIDYFIERVSECRRAGISDIILDPGFGFGKNISQNFFLLKEMASLNMFGLPILAGLSRKSTVCKTLNVSSEEALNGTTVMHTIALLNGASILRVHDVKEAIEATRIVSAYNSAG